MQYSTMVSAAADAVEALRTEPYPHHSVGDLFIYSTGGGSILLAVSALWTDDTMPHDLAIVLLDNTVLALRPTANPELVNGLARELERRGR